MFNDSLNLFLASAVNESQIVTILTDDSVNMSTQDAGNNVASMEEIPEDQILVKNMDVGLRFLPTYLPKTYGILPYFRISLDQNSSLILISISFNMPNHLPTPKFTKASLKSCLVKSKPYNAIMHIKTFD